VESAATTALAAQIEKPAEVDKWAPLMKALTPELEKALVGADGRAIIDAGKFARLALTVIRKNPVLQQATVPSLLGAIMTCAQLGLEPSGPLGHAYLVPFKEKGQVEVQLILGYQGMIQLALRSGMVASLSAEVVREKDLFEWEKGTNEFLRHKPQGSEGEVTHAWALAKLVTGGTPFVVLDRGELNATQARSKAGDRGPWKTDYDAMARKTAVRRLFRWLPSSVEIRGALGADNGVVRGIPESIEDLDNVIDAEGEDVVESL
jgi:recombination protein RecT